MVPPKINVNEIQTMFTIYYLRQFKTMAMLSGNVKEFAKLEKEHAKICVDNFELSKRVADVKQDFPFRAIHTLLNWKFSILNFFRPKSMSEIIYKKMLWADKKQKEFSKLLS